MRVVDLHIESNSNRRATARYKMLACVADHSDPSKLRRRATLSRAASARIPRTTALWPSARLRAVAEPTVGEQMGCEPSPLRCSCLSHQHFVIHADFATDANSLQAPPHEV